jgi:hypothetical protein
MVVIYANAIKLPHRNEVEQVNPGRDSRDRRPTLPAAYKIDSVGDERGAETPHRPGEPELRMAFSW